MGTIARDRDISTYFEHSEIGVEVVEEGLKPLPFGEYLVERKALSRAQLFQALSTQDLNPGVPLGEIVAALGFLPFPEVERLLVDFDTLPAIECN